MVLVFADDYRKTQSISDGFSSDLDALCQRDYRRQYFNHFIPCLDMDAYETSLSGQNDCTMDASVGIASFENNRISNKCLLLVELRLGYTTTSHFDYRNMAQKVCHTKDLLSDANVYDKFFFIFSEAFASRAYNDFCRMSRSRKEYANWLAMSPSGFLTTIHNVQDIPFVPINSPDVIVNEIRKAFAGGESEFLCKYEFWKSKADKYRVRNNLQEADSILNSLKNCISSLDGNQDDDMRGYCDMILEEIDRKRNHL